MKVGIIQSNFIPWKGYFDFIDDVDLFIYYDDRQYTKGDWRNRNRIKTPNGSEWITVPIRYQKISKRICDTLIDYSQNWIRKVKNKISNNYIKAPFFSKYADDFFLLLEKRFKTISELNININAWIMKQLEIKTETKISLDFNAVGTKTDRLIDILKKANATYYLSGPSAKSYLDENKFKSAGISLEYKVYKYGQYPQIYGPFNEGVTVLDLLFNCGEKSRKYLKSLKTNERVIV